jgi:hypothetical protein
MKTFFFFINQAILIKVFFYLRQKVITPYLYLCQYYHKIGISSFGSEFDNSVTHKNNKNEL